MKKFIACILTMITLLSCTSVVSQAKVGDVIGTALHTDIVVYINNYAVPSYAVNGTSVIVAEDLRNFGFDVVWNPYSKSLTIGRNYQSEVTPMYVGKGYTTGSKFTNILATDITVWAGGQRLTSYAMNGYTMIPVEELTMFGDVIWMADERALKMWVDGLDYLEDAQYVSNRYYSGTSVPDFGWITETICCGGEDQWDGSVIRVYLADSYDIAQYINYIKGLGYVLDLSSYDEYGYYECYINKYTRNGVCIQEMDDETVYVQAEYDIDYWVE